MRVVLLGADFEENLGIGMIAAVARERGHDVRVAPFNSAERIAAIAASIAREPPDLVGLSMQFQHRAHEFLSLAAALRDMGFEGHITCGGQFPTLAWQQVLERGDVDSVVFYDGEWAFGELLDALDANAPLGDIAGIALRGHGLPPRRTADRPLRDELDALPFPERYRQHTLHCGVPFAPIMGSRGCWGHCAYCSITTHYRDARGHGGGKTFRLRSPDDVAGEIAALSRRAGRPCIFCFHDDNFLLPRPADSLERVGAIRKKLDELGVGKVGFIGKCRPETVTAEIAPKLRELGVIRLYVGVENAAPGGAEHLGRGKQHLAIDAALAACRSAGIFTCYNLLLFEPRATLDDIATNIAFIREHAGHPVNFCRAEPYFGTPLQTQLQGSGALFGSHLGYDYRIADDRTELCFRISAAVFRERSFRPDGVVNRYMGLGYNVKVLEHFYEDRDGERDRLGRSVAQLTRSISLDTADYLQRVLDLARTADLGDPESIQRRAALLGLEIAASDALWQRQLDEAYKGFEELARRATRIRMPRAMTRLARGVAVGASLAFGAAPACGGQETGPAQASDSGAKDGQGYDGTVVDALPPDAGYDGTVVDALPPDAGYDGTVVDAVPPDAGLDAGPEARLEHRLPLIDQWRDTSPKRAVRSRDLPLFDPPEVRLRGTRDGDVVVARLEGGPEAVGLRWEGEGTIEGDGRVVRWRPASAADDTLRVAVRARGGLALVSLRARVVLGSG
jgi:anaerobic magnesium-protoporphyrin IX monomethyl ester cyclase